MRRLLAVALLLAGLVAPPAVLAQVGGSPGITTPPPSAASPTFTGTSKFGSGTCASSGAVPFTGGVPSISFTADTDSGFCWDTAGAVAGNIGIALIKDGRQLGRFARGGGTLYGHNTGGTLKGQAFGWDLSGGQMYSWDATGAVQRTVGGWSYDTAATPTPGVLTLNENVGLAFQGSALDANLTYITVTNPTAPRTFTLPNASGTALLATGTITIPTDGNGATFPTALFDAATYGPNESFIVVCQDPQGCQLSYVEYGSSKAVRFTNGGNFGVTIAGDYSTAVRLAAQGYSTATCVADTGATAAKCGVSGFADMGWGTFDLVTNTFQYGGALSGGRLSANRTQTLPDDSGVVAMNSSLFADAASHYGMTVMPDAGTASRFDTNTGAAAGALGVVMLLENGFKSSPAVVAGEYQVIQTGLAHVAIAEDQDVALGEFLTQSATAGYCNAGAIAAIGLNIARTTQTAPVTNTINPAGCTGGSGCINTALDTPNAGPAGQITLAADVAAQGWAVGDPVIYWNSGGTTPAGLTDGAVYFLASVSTTNVTLAAYMGDPGTLVVPTTQGDDATQYLQRLPKAIVNVF